MRRPGVFQALRSVLFNSREFLLLFLPLTAVLFFMARSSRQAQLSLIVMSMIMPIVQLVVLGYAFGGNVKNLKVGVIDQDGGVPAVRVSFADALAWVRHARPGDELPDLVVNPLRPGRVEPRAVKRRCKQYDLLNRPRDELRKSIINKRKQHKPLS